MKRQVNLYEVRFRREAPPLAAALLARIGAVALGLAALVAALLALRTQALEDRIAGLEQRRAAESSRVVELSSLHPPRQADARLAAEVARLEAERAARTELLGLLGGERLGNVAGFSAHIAGLARSRVEGVWLREIRIARGGAELALAGSATAPERVPRFLQGLGSESAFAGHEFRTLRLLRPDADPRRVDFDVRTRPEEAP